MGTFREDRRGPVEIWTLDAEDTRNAISRAVLAELESRVARVSSAQDVRTVILTGAGDKAFCAGADLKERATMSEAEVRGFLSGLRRVLRAVETSDTVFIAAINGSALGGGTELALACDFIYASENAKFGQPEVNLGVIPGFGGTQRLLRRVGLAKAKELIFSGDIIGADEALRIGLANRKLPADGFKSEALAIAKKIAHGPLVSYRYMKENVNLSLVQDFKTILDREAMTHLRCGMTEDHKEGVRAFMEKREPAFQGR